MLKSYGKRNLCMCVCMVTCQESPLEMFTEDVRRENKKCKDYKGICIHPDLGYGNSVPEGRHENIWGCSWALSSSISLLIQIPRGTWNLLPVLYDPLWHEGCPYQYWLPSPASLEWVSESHSCLISRSLLWRLQHEAWVNIPQRKYDIR